MTLFYEHMIEEKQSEVYEKKLIVVVHLSSINQTIYKAQKISRKLLNQSTK